MATYRRLVRVGLLLVATITFAASLRAAEEVVAISDQDEGVLAKYDSLLQADAVRTASKLRREAGSPMLEETIIRRLLALISASTALGGMVLLGCCVVVRRRKRAARAEWSHCLLAIGQRSSGSQPVLARRDATVSIPMTRTGRPKAMPIAAPNQWRRAA